MSNKGKRKGTAFESQVARFLSERLGKPGIERRALQGANDRGDIAGVVVAGRRVVIECKAEKSLRIPEYLSEAEAERVNDGAWVGVAVCKRRGVGEANAGNQLVCMTLETFARILEGLER